MVHSPHLHHDNSARLAGDFDLDERTFNEMHADLVAWMAAPHFTVRPELVAWLKNASPFDADV
jgi:hypothetical protein